MLKKWTNFTINYFQLSIYETYRKYDKTAEADDNIAKDLLLCSCLSRLIIRLFIPMLWFTHKLNVLFQLDSVFAPKITII